MTERHAQVLVLFTGLLAILSVATAAVVGLRARNERAALVQAIAEACEPEGER